MSDPGRYAVRSGNSWRNWAGNQVAHPAQIVTPRDVEELAELVEAAGRDGLRVKAIGSGHSFTSIGVTDGVQVRLERPSGLLSADCGTGLVTVGAGGDHRHRPGHRRARSAGLIPGGGAIHRGRRHPVVHLIRAGLGLPGHPHVQGAALREVL